MRAGMDAAVGEQLGERQARRLAAHPVEAGEHDGLRGVVDDEVDAGHVLEGADVAAFAADDATLHVVGGQVHDRHGGLGHVVGGGALDRQREDVARPPVGLAARLLLDLTHQLGHVVARVVLGLLEEQLPGLRGAHPRDAFERGDGFVASGSELVGELLHVVLAVVQRLLAPVLFEGARLELLLALHEALLGCRDLVAPAADLLLDLRSDLVDLFLGLELGLFEERVGLATRIAQRLFGFTLRPGELAGGERAADQVPEADARRERQHH